ncbi:MAG: glucose dehydrogenase [Acidimicrobiia bacterium]|nr:glucose dehydrogenase [Acidimicrobiia bacterium]
MRWNIGIVFALALVTAACRGDETTETTTLPTLPQTSLATTTTVPAPTSTAPPASSTTTTTTTTTLPPLQFVETELVADGFTDAVWAGVDPATGELLVIERRGRIRASDGAVRFDIDARVGSGGSEQGLLGLAFHPEDSDLFYVNYTDTSGNTVISEFQRLGGVMDASTERVLLEVTQPASNHNGGNVVFGPDGMLYVGMGDGGASNDRFRNGQNPFSLLGSMLRLDPTPSGDLPYTIPPDNPISGEAGDPLVYAYGLRNPWRFSFDADHLYIADVGQGQWEEVSVVGAPSPLVDNFGWPVLEGTHCFTTSNCDRSAGLTPNAFMVEPVVEYSHSEGCSVTGGVVMHDPAIPELDGFYVYGDYCGGFVRGFFLEGGIATGESEILTGLGSISSFGVDADGSVVVVSLAGSIRRIVPVR